MIDFVLNKELVNLDKEFGFTKAYFVNLTDVKDGNQLMNLKGFIAIRTNEKLFVGIYVARKQCLNMISTCSILDRREPQQLVVFDVHQ